MSRTFALFIVLFGSLISSIALAGEDGPYVLCQQPTARDADAAAFQTVLHKLFPDATVEVVPGPNDSWAVVGSVAAPGHVTQIIELANKVHPNVINGLRVSGPQQVQCRVFIAEVTQGRLTEMGIRFLSASDDDESANPGAPGLNRLSNATHVPPGMTWSPDTNMACGRMKNADELRGFIRALRQEGLAKIIAEPTLVTFSGRPAEMIVGGEFPIIVPGQQGTFSVEFREYGTRINLLPIALGHGRIRLEFRPEFSQLDYANGVTMSGFVIPGIQTRRMETEFELNSGETIVCGGLYSSTDSPQHLPMLAPRVQIPACAAIDAALSCLAPCTPRVCHAAVTAATHAARECRPTEKELIVMVSAEFVEPLKPAADETAQHAKSERHDERIWPSYIGLHDDYSTANATVVTQISAETDAEQPHPPAVLLNEVAPCPHSCPSREVPHVRAVVIRVDAADKEGDDLMLDDAGHFVIAKDARRELGCCREKCCSDDCDEHEDSPGCCRKYNSIRRLKCDDDDDECDEAGESLMAKVLESQMQCLEAMTRMRLNHEQAMIEAKAAGEIALARKDAEHAQAMARAQVEHAAQLERARQAVWDVERRMTEAQHRQALEQQRELAELRRDHLQQAQTQRLMSLENEVRDLRVRLASGQPSGAGHVTILPGISEHRGTPTAHITPEITVRVEDLQSGRVRYGPMHSSHPQPTVTRDVVEPVEFSTPPLSAGRKQTDDLSELRREVTRLRTLVEELLCVTADSPPAPIPQKPDADESSR